MDTVPALGDMVQLLEAAQVFHAEAARSSTGDLYTQHEEKSLRYAAMLAEIRHWEGDRRQHGQPQGLNAGTTRPDDVDASASFSRLIRRICNIEHASHSFTRAQ